MERYSVAPRHPNDFLYEYYQLGFEFGKMKVMSNDDMQNPMVQDLIQRNALIIQPYIGGANKEETQGKKSGGKRARMASVESPEINEGNN